MNISGLPQPIQDAIEALSSLPGIGSRSAERLVFSLLKNKTNLDQRIAQSLGTLKESIHECKKCYHLSQDELCPVCQAHNRDTKSICVVETPLDLVAIERTHEYRGLYHVLHGVISPLQKVSPQDIRIPQLIDRLKNDTDIQEVIIATSGSTESDATALYIHHQLEQFFAGTITRLSRGIPSGGDLDYLDAGTLSRAISERRGI